MYVVNASYHILINKRGYPETHEAILYTTSGDEISRVALARDEWWYSWVPRLDRMLDPSVSSKAQPTSVVIREDNVERGRVGLNASGLESIQPSGPARAVDFCDKHNNVIASYGYDGPADLHSIIKHMEKIWVIDMSREVYWSHKVDYDWMVANNIPVIDRSSTKTRTCILM